MENIYEPARLARDAITWAIPELYDDDDSYAMEGASTEDFFTQHEEIEPSTHEYAADVSSECNYSGLSNYTSPTTSLRSADMEPVEEFCPGWTTYDFSMQLESLTTSKDMSSCEDHMYLMEGLGVLSDLSLTLE
ncbi:hypothetical protein NW765_017595 [Fusarium oxysporum]|nr:hypothetical protein NW765_017595 [Fusarium oxysporum]